jgi:hypothetical protein
MIDATCEQIFKFKQENKLVKYIQCDDADKNQGLKTRLQSFKWKIPIKFEFTGRNIPQRNHLAEVALAMIASRGRAITSAAVIPKELRQKFWREAFQTSTYLDGLVLVKVDGVLKNSIRTLGRYVTTIFTIFKEMGRSRSCEIASFNYNQDL